MDIAAAIRDRHIYTIARFANRMRFVKKRNYADTFEFACYKCIEARVALPSRNEWDEMLREADTIPMTAQKYRREEKS